MYHFTSFLREIKLIINKNILFHSFSFFSLTDNFFFYINFMFFFIFDLKSFLFYFIGKLIFLEILSNGKSSENANSIFINNSVFSKFSVLDLIFNENINLVKIYFFTLDEIQRSSFFHMFSKLFLIHIDTYIYFFQSKRNLYFSNNLKLC